MMTLGISVLPSPPKPEITYGEFPFRLEYEIDGKRVVVEDTLICEYDGIGMNEGQGKYRKWKKHLASGNEKVILLKVDNTKEIYYDPGPGWYYMGDNETQNKYMHNFPDALFIEQKDKFVTRGTVYEKELLDMYNIKLIGWDYTQPIENNFIK